MKAIYFDGRDPAALVDAKAEQQRTPPGADRPRLRDASVWNPSHGIEPFAAVTVPDAPRFDPLAAAYVAAGAVVNRPHPTQPEPPPKARKARGAPPLNTEATDANR